MIGELQDNQYPNAESVYDRYASQASYMLITAMVMVSAYYGIVKPFNLVPSNPHVDGIYDETGLQCRFPTFFKSWREYENIHILFWAGKDTAWNLGILPMWIIFATFTFLIAFDFMWVSLWSKRGVIDHAHYVSQFMWVFANAVWALGEFVVTPNYDEPIGKCCSSACQKLNSDIIGLFNFNNPDAFKTSRWYSSWTVLASFIPLLMMYSIWVPATYMGKIDLSEDVHRVSLSHRQSLTESEKKVATEGNASSEQDHRTSEVELTSGALVSTSNPMTSQEDPCGHNKDSDAV